MSEITDKRVFTGRRNAYRIEVVGPEKDAHIHAYGIVPKNVRRVIDAKENSGMKNTRMNLEFIATILVNG